MALSIGETRGGIVPITKKGVHKNEKKWIIEGRSLVFDDTASRFVVKFVVAVMNSTHSCSGLLWSLVLWSSSTCSHSAQKALPRGSLSFQPNCFPEHVLVQHNCFFLSLPTLAPLPFSIWQANRVLPSRCNSGVPIQDSDPALQDNVLIPNNFFEYICQIGCSVSLHSITNSGLIVGGQNSSRERQTVSFRAVNPMYKERSDPYRA